ncbi:MAG: YcxB family protein [Clostridia bacterium]|nr:YcxB family protein [Clostridia bacterium]
MDALFICKFKPTEELMFEIQKTCSKKNISLENIFSLILIIIFPIILYVGTKDAITIPVGLLSGIFIVICMKLRFYSSTKIESKTIYYNSDKTEVRILFYDNNIISENEVTKNETVTDFTSITKVTQSKNLFFLFLYNNAFIIIDKNRFEKGTCEEFEEFIKTKAVNAKIKL